MKKAQKVQNSEQTNKKGHNTGTPSRKQVLVMHSTTQADLGIQLFSILQANQYGAQFQEIYAVKEYYKQLTAVIPIIFHSFQYACFSRLEFLVTLPYYVLLVDVPI